MSGAGEYRVEVWDKWDQSWELIGFFNTVEEARSYVRSSPYSPDECRIIMEFPID